MIAPPQDWIGRIALADARDWLASLPEVSLNCCLASPPFWGLRKYSGEQELVWGGEAGCQHVWLRPGQHKTGRNDRDRQARNPERNPLTQSLSGPEPQVTGSGASCSKCGGWRGPLGLEAKLDCGAWTAAYRGEPIVLCNACYICHSLLILRLIRRVLHKTGLVLWDIGDSRSGSGMKPLDMCLVPQTMLLAARADGWYVRSDIVIALKNPTPESCASWCWQKCRVKVKAQTPGRSPSRVGSAMDGRVQRDSPGGEWQGGAEWADCPGCTKCSPNEGFVLRRGNWRPTKAQRHLLMLAKSQNYWSDGEGVRQPSTYPNDARGLRVRPGNKYQATEGMAGKRSDGGRTYPSRNLRDVWLDGTDIWPIASESFPGLHFATFGLRFAIRCLKMACPPKVCSQCREPWARTIDKEVISARYQRGEHTKQFKIKQDVVTRVKEGPYRATCSCEDAGEPLPGVVIDPFLGSGTTALAAEKLGLRWAGCDLSPEYVAMAEKRLAPERAKVKLPLEVSG